MFLGFGGFSFIGAKKYKTKLVETIPVKQTSKKKHEQIKNKNPKTCAENA